MKETDVKMARSGAMPDEEIIDLYWARNERAIKETDNKYGKYLFTIAYNIVHDNLDCEECLNDTYLGTWNQIPPKRPTMFQIFLSRIMRNIAVDRFRKNTASRRVPSEMLVSREELDGCIESDMTVEEEIAVRELSQTLSAFLRTLGEREEFIVVCRYYYADKVEAIAKMLQVSAATVFRDLVTIRENLKAYLEKEGVVI